MYTHILIATVSILICAVAMTYVVTHRGVLMAIFAVPTCALLPLIATREIVVGILDWPQAEPWLIVPIALGLMYGVYWIQPKTQPKADEIKARVMRDFQRAARRRQYRYQARSEAARSVVYFEED